MLTSHPKRPHHHHENIAAHKVLVELGPGEYIPFAEGVAKPSHMILLWILFVFVWLASIGLLVWFAVMLAFDAPYYCSDAKTQVSGNYQIYYGRAAEPYCGKPTSVQETITNVGTCQDLCTADSKCLFFTHDQTHEKCYFYASSTLPLQNALAAIPGPTTFFSQVYVKNNGKVAQLRGALRNG